MRLLAFVSFLSLAACMGPPFPLPEPCPAVTEETTEVRDAESAVEAVRAHLATGPLALDLGGAEVHEHEHEWSVDVPRQASADDGLAPGRIPFRVCKADGEVEVPTRL